MPILHVRSAVAIWELRPIQPSARAMMAINTDRKKVLQTPAFPMVRAMRAVFCQLLRYWIIVLSSLSVPSSDDQGALTAAFNAFVADERTVDGPGT